MAMVKGEFLAIHSDDNLQLARSIYVNELHIHLGNPGPVVDLGGHSLQYSRIEFHGQGSFCMLNLGRQLWRYER